ncbi:MAG: ChbG/HpnK family deacetylase [Acutalibacteraceae bacterium]|nr:ChbG/HpnK family deacetylase [Acutalibacteraceae bacterium]
MIYFCADDYGISKSSNTRIEECLKNGVLNKISVLPNSDALDFKRRLLGENVKLSLHLNLIEGYPLSKKEDVSLLVSDKGFFKYSFIGLFFLSIFGNRSLLKKQLYNEIKMQIDFWKKEMGEETPILVDSHQHTHMIPLVFKTLMRVIKEENVEVEYIRIPAEPILPYIKSPSLYFKFRPIGLIKQWLLKFLKFVNRKELKKANIKSALFMGIMFSGQLTEDKINKLLPYYKKQNENIEIAFHPGYLESRESLIDGFRQNFKKFYYSKWRRIEYDTLLKFMKD